MARALPSNDSQDKTDDRERGLHDGATAVARTELADGEGSAASDSGRVLDSGHVDRRTSEEARADRG